MLTMEQNRKRCRIWYKKNIKKKAEANRIYRQTPSGKKALRKAWIKYYPKFKIYQTERNKKIREQIFAKYGKKCARCGFDDVRALQIDHVNGGGRRETVAIGDYGRFSLKVLHDNDGNYQILCANCNWIKRAENGEYQK